MPETAAEPTERRLTPREGDNRRPRPAFTPSVGMLDDHQRLNRWKNITIGVLMTGIVIVWLTVMSVTGEQKVTVIDPVGGAIQGPIEPLASSKGYFSIISINATQVVAQRSSIGLDLRELLPIYFSSNARKKLEDDTSSRQEEIRRRRQAWKPLIEGITPPQEAGDARVVKVSGRVQVTGVVNGRIYTDEPPFELIFIYRKNNDLGNKAAMPWLVDDVEISFGQTEVNAKKSRRTAANNNNGS